MSKTMSGVVVSTKMNKTIVVSVERIMQHPVYKKTIKRSKRYKAHYEGSDLKEGDVVQIQKTRPISKDTHFKVVTKE
jgi:small subunit ribosomal protein S17